MFGLKGESYKGNSNGIDLKWYRFDDVDVLFNPRMSVVIIALSISFQGERRIKRKNINLEELITFITS